MLLAQTEPLVDPKRRARYPREADLSVGAGSPKRPELLPTPALLQRRLIVDADLERRIALRQAAPEQAIP